MAKTEMFINCVPDEECRIAIVADGKLRELYQERTSHESHVGNIYKGRVVSVEPSIQAAFVDFGLDRNGFLHISDLHPRYFPGKNGQDAERVGKKTRHRDRPPIQKCLKRGQEILVQILKEGIGTKGPTLTSYLSIPGRYLVMMPHMERLGVSRKIDDDEARRAVREILDDLNPPKDFGFIIRTAGLAQTKVELKRDLAYLQRLWRIIDKRCDSNLVVGELYAESDLVIRTIRDVFSSDIERIIVDDAGAAARAQDYLKIASPRSSLKVFLYQDNIPLFHRYGIEPQINQIGSRTVELPSGGSIVIDTTEALVAIDVNSGKMRDNSDSETTAYKTNLEAADEICRQLRLRDLGGVVVLDLIDMRQAAHRRAVEQKIRNNLKNDRARTKTLAISQLGILEMTRQRMRPSYGKSDSVDCPHCQTTGRVKTPESVVLEALRRLNVAMHAQKVARVEVTISPDVAFQLLNRKRAELVSLEQRFGVPVVVRVHNGAPVDAIEIVASDERGGAIEPGDRVTPDDALLQPAASLAKDSTSVIDGADINASDADPESEMAVGTAVEEAQAESGSRDAAPKRRRRRGRRGTNVEPSGEATESDGGAGGEGDAEPPEVKHTAKEATADGTDAAPKRRRRRRGRRNASGDSKVAESDESAEASPSPSGDGEIGAGASERGPIQEGGTGDGAPPKRRRRRRGRRTSSAKDSAGDATEADAHGSGSPSKASPETDTTSAKPTTEASQRVRGGYSNSVVAGNES